MFTNQFNNFLAVTSLDRQKLTLFQICFDVSIWLQHICAYVHQKLLTQLVVQVGRASHVSILNNLVARDVTAVFMFLFLFCTFRLGKEDMVRIQGMGSGSRTQISAASCSNNTDGSGWWGWFTSFFTG